MRHEARKAALSKGHGIGHHTYMLEKLTIKQRQKEGKWRTDAISTPSQRHNTLVFLTSSKSPLPPAAEAVRQMGGVLGFLAGQVDQATAGLGMAEFGGTL